MQQLLRLIALPLTPKSTPEKVTSPVAAVTYLALLILPTPPVEVTSPVAAMFTPAQPSATPPPAPSSQRPLPHRTEDVASHVRVANPLKQRNKGGGAVKRLEKKVEIKKGGWR